MLGNSTKISRRLKNQKLSSYQGMTEHSNTGSVPNIATLGDVPIASTTITSKQAIPHVFQKTSTQRGSFFLRSIQRLTALNRGTVGMFMMITWRRLGFYQRSALHHYPLYRESLRALPLWDRCRLMRQRFFQQRAYR
jgi:hypothetical protein